MSENHRESNLNDHDTDTEQSGTKSDVTSGVSPAPCQELLQQRRGLGRGRRSVVKLQYYKMFFIQLVVKWLQKEQKENQNFPKAT